MTPAYAEIYLSDAQKALGSMFDYAIHDCGQEIDLFFSRFLSSGLAEQFEQGNPKYVGGMSGVELAREVFRRTANAVPDVTASGTEDRSVEYWTGWVMAYYQWYSGLRFSDMAVYGLTASRICGMYILHEADVRKFVKAANDIIRRELKQRETNLQRIRRAKGYSQRELSEVSGVSLRMIQLYEQRQNDINRAQAGTLLDLAQALSCQPRDLMELALVEDE